ncbi:MAG: hypothetical protein ACTSPB_01525 [Candidatus Thorarchaeota archaeon]
MGKKRKSPKRHTVHTKHPRYRVPRYPRGSDLPPASPSLRSSPQKRDIRAEMLAHQRGMGRRGVKSRFSRRQVVRVHRDRSPKAKEVDESLQARVTDDYNVWMRDPNRYDVYGVDYFPVPVKEGDLDWNYRAIEESMRDYYQMDDKKHPRPKPVFHTDGASYERAFGSPAVPHAFYEGETNEIHFSPRATRLLREGKISNKEDLWAFKTVVHEYEHARGSTRKNTGSAFDEGSTELLAERYAYMALQMPPKLREELKETSSPAYTASTYSVASVALIVNDYKDEKAIEWLKDLRTATPRKQKSIIQKAEDKLIKAKVIPDNRTLRKKIKRYEKKSQEYWDKADKLRSNDEEGSLRKLLGYRGVDDGGVLDVSTGLPDEEALGEMPWLKPYADKFVRLRTERKEAIEKAHENRKKADKLKENIKDPDIFTASHKDIDQESLAFKEPYFKVIKVKGADYSGRWWIDV